MHAIKNKISILLILTMLSACLNVFAATSTEDYSGVISVAEYYDGIATIAGQTLAPLSQVTVEVLDKNGSFSEITDISTVNDFKKLVHIQQTTTDNEGKFKISWSFPRAERGVYPIRVYSAADDRIYTSQLRIGDPKAAVYQTEHWYEDDDGNVNALNAAYLAVRTTVRELSGSGGNITVAVAKYDKATGALYEVASERARVFGNAGTKITVKVPMSAKNCHIKVFAWDDINAMTPLGGTDEFDTDVLTAPSGEDVYNDVIAHLGGEGVHPRIVASADDFARVREKLKDTSSSTYKEYNQLGGTFGYFEGKNLSDELVDGYNMLSASRAFAALAELYGLVYQVGSEADKEKRMQETWAKIEKCCNFSSWNPYHFLDTAEMAYGMGIAYDWLYDWLSDEQKRLMETAVNEKAFKPILEDYEEVQRSRTYYWSRPANSNNWNLVCNGGVMMAALAFMDCSNAETRENAIKVLTYGMKNIQQGLNLYRTTGEWEEGVTYWCYATKYLGYFLSSLDIAAGTDYGYADVEGLKESVDWILAMQGVKKSFNFGDTDDSVDVQSIFYWFADKYNDGNILRLARKVMENYIWADVYEILHIEDGIDTAAIEYPVDYFGTKLATAAMRSSTKDYDTYVGLHNGKNSVSHGQLDAGQFVIDSQGERFIKDLGKEDYNLSKWKCYRNRAEGHNTLVINPSSYDDQFINADCPLIDYGRVGDTSYAVGDLTTAYIDYANSVKRGVMLTDNRKTVIVRDEISLNRASELYWFAHTDAKVDLSEDKKTAVLELNGKYMQARILSGGAEFEIMDAEPLPTSPVLAGQTKNNCRKLAIHLTNFTLGTIEVGFAPISSPADNYAFTSPGSLDEWKRGNSGTTPGENITIACWGDSLTYGEGSTNASTTGECSYPGVLAKLTNQTVMNYGVAGETSMTIAARQGAKDILLPKAFTIPESGTVNIPLASVDMSGTTAYYFPTAEDGKVVPRNADVGGWNPVTINGVSGNLRVSVINVWPRMLGSASFTRTAPGAAVEVAAGDKLITSASRADADVNIFFTGTNGGWNTNNTTPADSAAEAKTLAELINTQIAATKNPDKYIVIGLTSGDAGTWQYTNETLSAAFKEHFLDAKSLLASESALLKAGVTATQQDIADISAGRVPASLRSDITHLNDTGYALLARLVYEKLVELGYIKY